MSPRRRSKTWPLLGTARTCPLKSRWSPSSSARRTTRHRLATRPPSMAVPLAVAFSSSARLVHHNRPSSIVTPRRHVLSARIVPTSSATSLVPVTPHLASLPSAAVSLLPLPRCQLRVSGLFTATTATPPCTMPTTTVASVTAGTTTSARPVFPAVNFALARVTG